MFDTHFCRPQQLSDPHGDFDLMQEELDAIVRKAPGELKWRDFKFIYHAHLPAASYLEGGYYLPWALGLLRDQPLEASEYLGDLIWWISEHAADLDDRSNTIDRVRGALKDCFKKWTESFEVLPDEPASYCNANGLVINSEIVCNVIDELLLHQSNTGVAVEFIESIK
ncbi:MAG TPA: hypothetical protein VNT79_04320 [Phycisphaerae bacterium]|nr:hypothetical protein [Phycisphaerae bacterium]